MRVLVLRLGHRPLRDKRITTHVGLVARALGAEGMILTVEDMKVKASIQKVVNKWGGNFYVKVERDWKGFLKRWEGIAVHLTMYGLPLDEMMPPLREYLKDRDLLTIVGSEKVPKDVFDLADYNISVTNQPHSEIAALSLFLDRLFEGKELNKDFGGRIRILPSARSKRLMSNGIHIDRRSSH
jgi:tRNA (cytidine56-2'-O)-methyltransferase